MKLGIELAPRIAGRSDYLDFTGRMLDNFDRGVKRSKRLSMLHRASLSIVNECNADCGENIGGSSAAPAAPEAASDDDGGDGDGDPEPERRRKGRPCNSRNTLPATVEHFDRLPDTAQLDISALKALTGKSRATIYRWIDKGLLPKPRKIGLTHNTWAAGDIRRALQA